MALRWISKTAARIAAKAAARARVNTESAAVNESLPQMRFGVCAKCPELTQMKTCRKCGCFMPAKVGVVKATCPLGKW